MNELPESPVGQDADAAIHHELLERLLEDEAGEGLRSVASYQAMFRGHEALVERVVAELQGSSEATFEGRDRIGSYVLLEEIGRGGQGTVFLARDTRLPRLVALKLLSNAAGDLGRTRIERFRREAQAASKLDHPGICAVYETGEVDDIQFLAMRHVAGESLAMHIARAAAATDARSSILHLPRSETSSTRTTRRREFDATLHFVERVARALHVAHEAGIVHRDIKPGNIMVTPGGEPVVLDFGLARDLGDTAPGLTRTDEVFGTPAYMALEQLRPSGRGVDRRADIYALGVTLFECLTLQRPYALRNPVELADAIERGQAPDPRDRSPGLPTDLAVVVACAMASRPEARYQTALDFADDLRAVREFEAIQARPAGALLKSWRWMQRNPGVAVSLALVILSLSTALIVSLVALDEAAYERSVAKDEARHRGDLNEFLRLVLESPNPHLMGPETSIQTLLERASKRLDSDLAARPRSRSEALAILGDSYFSLGLGEVAAENHRKAAEIEAELAPGSSNHLQRWYRWMHVDSSQATAQVSVERGRELLLAIRRASEPLPAALYADILGWFGRRLGDTNEFDEMLAVYDELERLYEGTPTDAVAVEVLRLRMHCRSSQARWGEALAAAQELASLLEMQPGLTSELDYEQVQQSVTHLAMRVGRREDALAAHTKTLDHTIQVLGPDHSTLAVMWSNQATLTRMVGRHADAEEPYKEALRISRLTRTPPHDTIAINLNNLGALHRYLGNYEQAQELLEEALRMLIELNGEQHVKVANAMSNVVDIHFDQRHLPEALEWQRRCLAMRRELVGNGHFETVNGCFRLARIEIANGDSGRGVTLLEEALPRTRELDPGGRLKVLQTAIDAARELAAAASIGEDGIATTPADLEPALLVAQETLAQVLEIAPDRKDAILRHRTVLGVLLWRAGKLDDAVRQFEGGREIAGEGRPQDAQKLETRIAEFQAATGRAVPEMPAQRSAEQSERPTEPGK